MRGQRCAALRIYAAMQKLFFSLTLLTDVLLLAYLLCRAAQHLDTWNSLVFYSFALIRKAWHTDLRVSNTTTLVFLTFIVNWRSQQKACKTSSYFCNPARMCDMRAKSSAYKSKWTTSCPNIGGVSPSKTFNRFSKPSMKRPNRSGLKGHPCFTPMR